MNFCHLHLHSQYSLLDGANRLEEVVKRAAELGMPALALTDHGNLFGAVQFHDLAVQHGVKPIIGCEVYMAQDGRKSKNGRSARANHLVLLASNEIGYQNLVRLVSLGYLEGFYYRPRIDKELLSRYSEGLICLSACLQGSVASCLSRDRYQLARKEAGEFLDIFGPERFFLELQDHGLVDQKVVNKGIIELSRDLEVGLVATNDCHYLNQDDATAHDVLLCIQTGKTIEDTNRMTYQSEEFFFKTAEQMNALFGHHPEALSNTLKIAEMCDFRLPEAESIFPEFDVPSGDTVDSYFEKVVRRGFEERLRSLENLEKEGRLRHPIAAYRERLDREIQMIRQMNFAAYFLIVWDFIRHAREEQIPVGPGRGSAAGSLVSYCLRITNVDPLQYDLLFERFLNPERVTPPDIDIDFCMNRRSEVIDYVTRRYGRDNVSHIITFGTMAARGAIRDVGRGLNVPYAEVDKLAKLVPLSPDTTIDGALKNVRELRELADSNPKYQELMEIAGRLEGLSRHASIHAAGVVIAPRPLIELIPLYKSTKDEITTQYPMSDLERLGLLKMDFLGLTTLTVITQALKQIEDQLGKSIDLETIPLDDPKTLELFCEGKTGGIFQFESSGMRDILGKLQPSRFEDLIALNALYRPGPIQGGMIEEFINRRHGRVKVEYELPELEEILKETYGVIVYQEQVMQIASRLGGFSLGEADLLRRAMGKKKKKVMEAQRKKFLRGAERNGFDADKARRIFDLMQEFAGYGFNKGHSTAYALLAYQTGYLKAHYPVQFMAALLTNEMSNTDKIIQYQNECREMGIQLEPPDINRGEVRFVGSGDATIQFGLAAVKNVGEAAIQTILDCRHELGEFKGFFQFCEEVDQRTINRRVMEALIKAGAFDSLGYSRKSLMEVLDRALEHGAKAQRDRISGQKGLFGEAFEATVGGENVEEIPDQGEWSDRKKWRYEKEALGFYLSGHPLRNFGVELKRFSPFTTRELKEMNSGRDVELGGIIASVRVMQTRKGDSMAAIQLEDLDGTIEVLLWPSVYEGCRHLLTSDDPVFVSGRLDVDARGETKILCSELTPLSMLWKKRVERATIRITLPGVERELLDRFDLLLRRYPGDCPLEFELYQQQEYSVRLIPADSMSVDPVPGFIKEIENLFGKDSCQLQLRPV